MMKRILTSHCWRLSLSLAVIATLFLFSSHHSVASDKMDALLNMSIEELLNITVTSTSLTPETAIESASTVDLVTREEWQDRGARQLMDALNYSPGMTVIPHFLGTRKTVIRGFINSNGTGVLTLWDGVPLNTLPVGTAQLGHQDIQLNTLNSIEIIRGPGSAIHGADALHGVISLNSYESDEDENLLIIRAGSKGYGDLAYNGSKALNKDWRYHVAIGANGQPGQSLEYDYLDTGVVKSSVRENKFASYTVSAKLKSDAMKPWSYEIGLYRNRYSHEDFFFDGVNVAADDSSDMDISLDMMKATVSHRIDNNSSLKLEASNWTEEHEYQRILPNGNTIHIFVDEEIQQAIKLVYSTDKLMPQTQLNLSLNHRYNEIKNAYVSIITPSGSEVRNTALFFSSQGREVNSLVVDAKTRLTDTHVLHYGFRYDDYSDFGEQINPRLAMVSTIDPSTTIKLLYGQAFRAPTYSEIYGSPLITGNPNLLPEENETTELVYIKQGLNWTAEIVLFYTEWRNGIETIDTDNDGDVDLHANAAGAISRGIEIKYLYQFQDWLIDSNGSYAKINNDTLNTAYETYPEYIFNIALARQLGNNWLLRINNRIQLNATRAPQTATWSAEDIRDYWRLDVNLSKKYSARLEIFANIKNLLNRDNYLSATRISPQTADTLNGIQDETINLDMGIRYSF